jgi:hypothetical protein
LEEKELKAFTLTDVINISSMTGRYSFVSRLRMKLWILEAKSKVLVSLAFFLE